MEDVNDAWYSIDGRKLTFDAASKTIVNDPFANALLVGNPPRKGWEAYYNM